MELTVGQALQKAIEAHKVGAVQEADRLYTAILKVQPKHPEANHNLGVLAVGVGKLNEALPYLKTALEVDPSVAQYWVSYTDLLIKLGQINEASDILNQVKERGAYDDNFDSLFQKLHGEEIGPVANNLREREPPQEQFESLRNLYYKGEYHLALNQIKPLITLFPDSASLYNLLGAIFRGAGKLDLSVEAYKKAIATNPDFPESYSNMGVSLHEQGKLTEAIKAYKKALAIKPDYSNAHYLLGNVLKEQGLLERAIAAYEEAVAIQPKDADAYNNLGISLHLLGKLDDAIVAYGRALEIKSNNTEVLNNMSIALTQQGKLEEAIDACNNAILINPNLPEAYNSKANAYTELGKLEQAIVTYKKALVLKPGDAFAIENLSNIGLQLSDTNLITTEELRKLELHCNEALNMPKFQIQKAIQAFLNADRDLVLKHLTNYSSCDEKTLGDLNQTNQVFCSAYHKFLTKLVENQVWENKLPRTECIFHLGESHCLSFAHCNITINGVEYKIIPKITFGGKAFHFSRTKDDKFKSFTKYNFDSLPNASKVLISFGEIDCRPNEGFMSAAEKYNANMQSLISNTVKGYLNWFEKQNSDKNHFLYFFNLPAPVYNHEISADTNSENARTVMAFNTTLKKFSKLHRFNLIDVFHFTVNADGFSNERYHLDRHHLGPKAIPVFEPQLTSNFPPTSF